MAKGKLEETQQRSVGALNNLDAAINQCISAAQAASEAANYLRASSRMAAGDAGNDGVGLALAIGELDTLLHDARRVIQQAKQKVNQASSRSMQIRQGVEEYMASLVGRRGGF